jgi:hypothetical protein
MRKKRSFLVEKATILVPEFKNEKKLSDQVTLRGQSKYFNGK